MDTRRQAQLAVVGVADHSGWANLVTVAVSGAGNAPADGSGAGAGSGPGTLVIADRRRCTLVGPDVPRQPYHAAEGLPDGEAEALVARVTAAARQGAAAALAELVTELGDAHELVAMTMRAGGARPLPPTVAGVLASHSAMHAAEGELYREALSEAAEARGIDVVVHARGELESEAAAALGVTTDRLGAAVAALGRSAGPPWQKEHRQAAVAAIAELARRTGVELDGGPRAKSGGGRATGA